MQQIDTDLTRTTFRIKNEKFAQKIHCLNEDDI